MITSDLVNGLKTTDGLVTSDSDQYPTNKPGTKAFLVAPEGVRVYKYVKFEEAVAIGQCVMSAALIDNADVDQAQAIGTKVLKGTGDFTASEFGNGSFAAFPDAYVTIDAGVGVGQTHKIDGNRGSTDYLNLHTPYTVALDTTADYVTYSPNYVSLLDTDDVGEDGTFCLGVAISAMTDEYWGWVQIKGFCPLIRAVGSTHAIVKGEAIVPSSTAGACKGNDATTDAVDGLTAFGLALHAYAEADSAGIGIAAILDCRFA